MKLGTSKRIVSQAERAVKKMLLCVVSLSRGFTEPFNYSSFELLFSVCPSRLSVSNMIPHLSEKGYILRKRGVNVELQIAGEDEQGGSGYR
jgi:hypothetical protein